MAASPQTLTEAQRRLVASWAADCADRVLHVFETEIPDDPRPRDGIERARAFGRGELGAAEVIRRRFEASRAAAAATGPAAKAAVWAAGQASAVAHMAAHALGAAAYAAKAASLGAADAERARRDEVRWQLDHMTPQVRAALVRLPLLGEDPSGPLGKGLLATGTLAATIRDIQDELRSESSAG
ncbi:hypothetical protein EII34_13100 [Arachnia propionica]|uniref:Imm-5-like domain-containing protein n=1 Tax=Arachnia propionica TaxID=1750 RepID=A0A3P1T3K0_9ACTN|nr:hypothetical protein [Arachnia propionica]RRD03735.1 hypothetical protein EII34_13100 [Arachnia propionica]